MSAILESVNNEFFDSAIVPVTAYPFTFACWAKVAALTANMTSFSIANSGSDENYHFQWFEGTGGDYVYCQSRQTAGGGIGANSGGPLVDTNWHLWVSVWNAAQDRRAYIDISKGTNVADSATPTGLNRWSIGRNARSSAFSYFNGNIAECAIWNISLSDADVALLAGGDNSLTVQNANLLSYWRLYNNANDGKGTNHLTANGTISFDTGEHPVVDPPESPSTNLMAQICL